MFRGGKTILKKRDVTNHSRVRNKGPPPNFIIKFQIYFENAHQYIPFIVIATVYKRILKKCSLRNRNLSTLYPIFT